MKLKISAISLIVTLAACNNSDNAQTSKLEESRAPETMQSTTNNLEIESTEHSTKAKPSEKIDYGSWRIKEEKDPITDAINRNALLPAKDNDNAFLAILCKTKTGLVEFAVSFENNVYEEFSEVVYRVGSGEPVEDIWGVYGSIYYPPREAEPSNQLHLKLFNENQFAIRNKPLTSDTPKETLIFDIAGFENAFKFVQEDNGCKKQEKKSDI